MAEQCVALAPGIKQTEQGAPCMAADLHRMNETALTAVPAGFRIEEVATESALHDFKQVFVESNEIPERAGRACVASTQAIGIVRASIALASPEATRQSAELRAQAAVTVDRITGGYSTGVADDWCKIKESLGEA